MNPFSLLQQTQVRAAYASLAFAAILMFAGCPSKSANKPATGGDHAHDEHDHGHTGPHDGHILEFGTEDHHAELTHDEATHKVGVYMLDSDAKTLKPVKAASATINVAVDGKPKQYELKAAAPAGEPEGTTSYFEIEDELLCNLVSGKFDAKDVKVELRVSIDGVPHTAPIEIDSHDHDHGHDHDHK
jgi:hypothetical protein